MLYNPINGAWVAPSFYRISAGRPLPSHQRGIAGTSVRPKGSRTHSDAPCLVSHVLRPSPYGTDISRLTVFDPRRWPVSFCRGSRSGPSSIRLSWQGKACSIVSRDFYPEKGIVFLRLFTDILLLNNPDCAQLLQEFNCSFGLQLGSYVYITITGLPRDALRA
jgi:hypothetical protein